VLTQLTVPGEARPLKIAPEAIYSSSFEYILKYFQFYSNQNLWIWGGEKFIGYNTIIVPSRAYVYSASKSLHPFLLSQ